MTDTEKAIQELEDMAYHPSLKKQLSDTALVEALKTLHQITKQDKLRAEGRLLVLPCRTGRTVYLVDGKEINRCITENTLVRNGLMARMIETSVVTHYAVYPEDVGKTVFLTRGEAEAALERRKTS